LSDAQTAQFYGEGWYRRLIAAFHGNPREDESGTLLNIQRKYGQWVCARLAELILGGKIAPLWGGVLDSPQRLPRILDVGASSGALGAQLGGILTGLDPALGEGEGPACDRAIRATLESVTDEELQPPFDLIICAQTLDHLRDPRGGLERMRNWLVPKGVLWVDILDVKADLRLRGHLRWVRKLDHNFGFLPYSLRWLLDKTGYEMVSETPWRGHCMRHHFGVLARRKP
jgi:SAM-dependent methyltransferase